MGAVTPISDIQPMRPYALRFGMLMIGLILLGSILKAVLGLGSVPGASYIVALAAAVLTAKAFFNDHGRHLNVFERRAVVMGSLLVELVIPLVVLLVVWMVSGVSWGDGLVVAFKLFKETFVDQIGWPLTLLAFALIIVSQWGLLLFGYGALARKLLASEVEH